MYISSSEQYSLHIKHKQKKYKLPFSLNLTHVLTKINGSFDQKHLSEHKEKTNLH